MIWFRDGENIVMCDHLGKEIVDEMKIISTHNKVALNY